MMREFLTRKADKWTPVLQRFFEKRGITIEGVTDQSAVLHYSEESLSRALKTSLWLGALESAFWLASGIAIGALLK